MAVLSSGPKLTSKPELQALLRRIRKAGYDVAKDRSGIYRATDGDKEILVAMPGTRGYMFSYDLELIHGLRRAWELRVREYAEGRKLDTWDIAN